MGLFSKPKPAPVAAPVIAPKPEPDKVAPPGTESITDPDAFSSAADAANAAAAAKRRKNLTIALDKSDSGLQISSV